MALELSITRRYVDSDYFKTESKTTAGAKYNSYFVHREMTRFTGLQSHNVVVTFGQAFAAKPIGIDNLKVYRMYEITPGNWGIQDVLFTFPSEEDWLTTTGFEINISPFEALSGIWIEYNFTE